MAAFTVPVWLIDLCLVCVDLFLRLSWANALPVLAFDPYASVSPGMIVAFGVCALLFGVGAWLSRGTLNDVPAAAWNGWNLVAASKEDRSWFHLPYDLDLLFPVLYQRRRARAGKMTLQGRDTTAAVGFSLILLIAAVVGVVSFFNGEANALSSDLIWFTAPAFIFAAVSLGYAVRSIGRGRKDREPAPNWQGWVSFGFMLPLIVCLLGALGAISVGLSLHADQFPPTGFDVVVYIITRALFMGVAAWLLVYAPRKIAILTLKRAVISGKWFFVFLVCSYAIGLTADWFLFLYK